MALSSSTVFEVRTTGSDNNGGGFVTGASGTDYSQQTTAQYALTGLTTTGATAVILTTSAAAAMVGNLINITGGTNFTTGIYQILSVSVGTSITVDRTCATGVGASGTGNIGGCFASIAKVLAQMTVAGMQAYVKATATYSISTGLSTSAGSGSSVYRIIGYTTTRGDGGQATIQATANITAFTDSNGHFRLENLIFDGDSLTAATGVSFTGTDTFAYNCIMRNFSSSGVNFQGNGNGIIQCSITGNGSGIYDNQNYGMIKNNYINANTGAGIQTVGSGCAIVGNIISNNSGASSDGIIVNNNYGNNFSLVTGNVLYTNGRDGFRNTGAYNVGEISNNIFVSNGGYGLNTSAMTPVVNEVLFHHNAYYNNTTAARNGNNAGVGDVTLTGVPFVNAGSANYALNSTAGQGAACQTAGFPGVLPAGGTGYIDIGALQHQSTSASMLVNPGLTGGMHG